MMARLVITQINEKVLELRYGEQARFMLESGKMIDNTGEEG